MVINKDDFEIEQDATSIEILLDERKKIDEELKGLIPHPLIYVAKKKSYNSVVQALKDMYSEVATIW